MATPEKLNEAVVPLRVAQLDAIELDDELMTTISNRVDEVFRHSYGHNWAKLSALIKLATKIYLAYFTVVRLNASYGMQIMDLSWDVKRSSQLRKLGFMVFLLSRDLTSWVSTVKSPKARLITAIVEVIRVANFVCFLTHGFYPGLAHRLVRLPMNHPHKLPSGELSFDYTNRELLWHSFIELLDCATPLINFRKLCGRVLKWSSSEEIEEEASGHKLSDQMFCGVCHRRAIIPHSGQCQHICCYICWQLTGSVCPICSQDVAPNMPKPFLHTAMDTMVE